MFSDSGVEFNRKPLKTNIGDYSLKAAKIKNSLKLVRSKNFLEKT